MIIGADADMANLAANCTLRGGEGCAANVVAKSSVGSKGAVVAKGGAGACKSGGYAAKALMMSTTAKTLGIVALFGGVTLLGVVGAYLYYLRK